MGTVTYKFTYNSEIDFPKQISFNGKDADLASDNNFDFTISGKVKDVSLFTDGKLNIYASTSGRAARTWELEVTYDDRKLSEFPIEGTIKGNGKLILKEGYELNDKKDEK